MLAGAKNLTTQLGANFSIRSLTFTPDATSPIQINDSPGTHSLTIGTGGITDNGPSTYTINAGVALGGVQTWANNTANPFTVNGMISGAAGNDLTLGGTGLFTFGGANTYSGATSIFTGGLTLSGNGSILNTSAISLNAGTSLTLDNTTTNANRLAGTVGISSNGGFITLLGNSSASTAQSAGTLAINAGATYVTVTPGSGQSATLTFGSAGVTPSFSHAVGGTVTFSSTGTINAPNVTLINTAIPANAIIGGWATIGTTGNASSNTLDWATVNGSGQVVPLASLPAADCHCPRLRTTRRGPPRPTRSRSPAPLPIHTRQHALLQRLRLRPEVHQQHRRPDHRLGRHLFHQRDRHRQLRQQGRHAQHDVRRFSGFWDE